MSRRKLGQFVMPRAAWWDAHEDVIVRDLNTEDEEWIQDQIVQGDSGESTQYLVGKARRLLLMRAIVSWTFTDPETHQPVPFPAYSDDPRSLRIREKSIKELAPEDSGYIYDQINARAQAMSPAEQESFLTPASPGSLETAPSSPTL